MATIDTLIDEETILHFEEYTMFDLSGFLTDFKTFVQVHYGNIIAYYRGDTNDLNQESKKSLEKLETRSLDLRDKLDLFIEDFNTFDYWSLLQYLEDVMKEIDRAGVIYKYLRSSKYDGFNEDSLIQDYPLGPADTLESVASKDRDDSQNSWTDIALKNHLESIYWVKGEGGINLKLGKRVLENFYLESVIDRLQGETVYGIDLNLKDFGYDADTQDFKVLSYRDTFKQSVDILASLKRGDLPEFEDLGLSSDRVVGSNLADFAFPFIIRELEETFATDDTILNFGVTNIKREGSTIYMDFILESFYNFVYIKNAAIQI